jgi:LPXTG-motif cell wall-anchored protein
MTIPPTNKARLGATALIAGLLLTLFGFASPSLASTADPSPTAYDGNVDCAAFGYAVEFKINMQPVAGTYEAGDAGVEVKGELPEDLYVTISNVESPGGRLEFDFTSNYAWSLVLVKQADGGLAYHYDPAVTHDENVQTVEGQNSGGISHVTFCNPTTPPVDEEECPAGTTWDDANDNDMIDEGECVAPGVPEADLAASVLVCATQGIDVTVINSGDGAGTVDVLSNDVVVHNDVALAAGQTKVLNVVVAEDAAYDIEVVGVQSFTGTRDCAAALPNVVTKEPAKPTTQVAGIQVQRAAPAQPAAQARQLPRTGENDTTMALIGFGLVFLGAGALLISKQNATA